MKTPRLWVTIDKRGFSRESLKRLLEYDIAGIRINTGRCSYAWIYEMLEELNKLNYPLSQILLDIGNTKPRLNLADKNGLELENESLFSISSQAKDGVNAVLLHHRFFKEVNLNDVVYFGDGEIEAIVEEINQSTVILRSLSSGRLGNNVAIGIKGKDFFKFLIDEKEISEVNLLLYRFPISLILSFIESGDNLVWAKKVFPQAASIIPKIETVAAVFNIQSILVQSETIFVGRGDLGLSLGIEKIGIIQKEIILKAREAGCKISIGTGTLDSLKWSKTPLRAEVIDITNSCLEGIDYITLTSETAASQTPFKVLDLLKQILDYIKSID